MKGTKKGRRKDLGQGQAACNRELYGLLPHMLIKDCVWPGARGAAADVATHVACAAPTPALVGRQAALNLDKCGASARRTGHTGNAGVGVEAAGSIKWAGHSGPQSRLAFETCSSGTARGSENLPSGLPPRVSAVLPPPERVSSCKPTLCVSDTRPHRPGPGATTYLLSP